MEDESDPVRELWQTGDAVTRAQADVAARPRDAELKERLRMLEAEAKRMREVVVPQFLQARPMPVRRLTTFYYSPEGPVETTVVALEPVIHVAVLKGKKREGVLQALKRLGLEAEARELAALPDSPQAAAKKWRTVLRKCAEEHLDRGVDLPWSQLGVRVKGHRARFLSP